MLKAIYSGGQTGVDILSLEVARELGIPTGGTCPKNCLTEAGHNYKLKTVYGLKESTAYDYSARTYANVKDSDGTALFGDMSSAGSKKTITYCKNMGKPYIENPDADNLQRFIAKWQVKILNIAGNRGSKLDEQTARYIRTTLQTALEPWRT